MSIETRLSGIKAAKDIFNLTYEEIAYAVQTNPSTLYRWRQGHNPTAVYLSRLDRLDDLAAEIQRTVKKEEIADWLARPAPAFDGRTPREMILAGRSETVLGALLSLNRGFAG